jgi:drug/metabolite transporter superfamily protein YnfA
MFKIKNLLVTLVASIIVMFGCILMWIFISNETSVVSILYGTIAMFLLFGAIEFWEKKLKEWFKMEDRKKNIN